MGGDACSIAGKRFSARVRRMRASTSSRAAGFACFTTRHQDARSRWPIGIPETSSVARTSSGPASICGPALPPATAVSFSCRARPCGTLVMQIPALGIGLIEGLSFKGKCYSALVQMLGTRSVTDRLAHLLLHLVDAYGIKVPDGTLIGAAFTHADLAHMVGATRQWVTISLQRLQEQGVVVCRKSQVIVRRLDALSEMRGGREP